jgi:hypothetical protein
MLYQYDINNGHQKYQALSLQYPIEKPIKPIKELPLAFSLI